MSRPQARLGFTLVETLLALAVVAALLGSMFAFLSGVLARADHTRTAIREQRGIDAFFSDLERSLATTFVGERKETAGIQGSGASVRVHCRGTIADGGSLLDLRGSEYRLNAGSIEGRRWGGVDASADIDEQWAPMVTGVQLLRLRYFDGRSWLSDFASFDSGKLPLAVEVAVWMGTGDTPSQASVEPSTPTEPPNRAPDRITTIAIPDAGGGS